VASAAAVAAGLNAHHGRLAVDKQNGTHATLREGQAYYNQQPELWVVASVLQLQA
jgi:hypothetical protein